MFSKKLHIWSLKFKALLLQDTEALHELGAWYASGEIHEGTANPDFKKAFKYYKRAASLGHPESQYDLGFMYWAGDLGIKEKDEETAIFWFQKAAEQGYEPAIGLLKDLE